MRVVGAFMAFNVVC